MSTLRKTEEYCRAVKLVKQAERDLEQAKSVCANAENELVKWLLPAAAKPGMSYGIWVPGRSFGYGDRDVLVSLVPKMQTYCAVDRHDASEVRQDGYTIGISSPESSKEPT